MKFWKFYSVLVASFVLLGGAIIYGPAFIDWNDHKQAFRTAVFEASGCHLSIDGDLSMDLLPVPKITMAEVRLTEDSELGAPSILVIKGVHAALSFRELLIGNIQVERMELLEPEFLVPIGEKNLCDETAPGMTVSGEFANERSREGGGKKINLSIRQLEIFNGSIPIKIPGKTNFVDLTGLNFQVTILRDGMKATIKGHGLNKDAPYDFDISLSGMDKGHAPSLYALLSFPNLGGQLKLSGEMTQPIEDGVRLRGAFNGTVNFEAKNSQALLQDLAPGYVAGTSDKALSFESEIQITSRYLGLNNYSFENGPMRGAGAVSVRLSARPAIDVLYSAKSLDLDEILTQMPIARIQQLEMPAISNGLSLTEISPDKILTDNNASRIKKVHPLNLDAILEELTRDLKTDISIDLTIGAFKYMGGVVREAGLHVAFGDGTLTLDRASAIFPGGSDVSLFGFMEKLNGAPHFDGKIAIQSDDFKRFLTWAEIPESILQNSRLRSVAFHSDLRVSPDFIRLPSIDLTLDTSKITGGMGLYFTAAKPKIKIDLNADKLNLDAYLDLFDVTQQVVTPTTALGVRKVSPETITTVPERLRIAQLDADIKFAAAEITMFGRASKAANVHFKISDEHLTLHRLNITDYATLSASAVGAISNIKEEPNLDFSIELSSDGLSSVFSSMNLGTEASRWAHDLGAVKGALGLKGPIGNLIVNSDLSSSNAQMSAKGVLSHLSDGLVMSLESGKYKSANWSLADMRGVISSTSKTMLSVRNFESTLPRGQIIVDDLVLKNISNDGYELNASGGIRDIPVNAFMSDLGDLVTLEGDVDLSFDASTKSENIFELWKKKTIKGTVSGNLRLRGSASQMGSVQLQPIQNVQNFMVRHFGTNSYPVSGNYIVEKEIVKTELIKLESSTAMLHAEAFIDLGANTTTASLNITEKGADESYITMGITGPWSRPSVKSGGVWIKGAN